jgi:mycothiol synthase
MRAPATAGLDLVSVPAAPAIPGLTFRRARRDDWPVLTDVVNRARGADGVDEVFGPATLRAEYEPTSWFDIGRDVLLAELDGKLIGMAFGYRIERGASLALESWGVVLPEHRHQGIGTALHLATRDRLTAEAAEDARPGQRSFQSWALDLERSDLAILADQGYVPIRFGFQMRRFLTGSLPDHPLPSGLELRPVTPDQHRAIFEADNEAFRDHWGSREQDDGDFRAHFDHPETDTTLWQVAWDGDEVAGVVMNAIFHDENEQLGVRRGWLDHVSVRRPWRGKGVAKALCAASFATLQARGMEEAWLGVDAANPTGALQLYEGLGFHVARRWQALGRPLDGPAREGWRPEGHEAV